MCLPSQILKYKSNLSYFCTVDVRGLSQKVKASAHSHTAKGHPCIKHVSHSGQASGKAIRYRV